MNKRTSPKKLSQKILKYFRPEHSDYNYIKTVFSHLRKDLKIEVKSKPKKLPYVPTEDEIKRYYETVWQSKNMQDMLVIKTLLYTGMRVSELINVKLDDIDLASCQIKIVSGKGKKDRQVPFPKSFRETLALHINNSVECNQINMFESSWKKPYSDRGIRNMLEKYSKIAKLKHNISPHKLRHFLFTWLKKKGIDDALIQPYSGHESRQSLEIYSKLSLSDAQDVYEENIKNFPI